MKTWPCVCEFIMHNSLFIFIKIWLNSMAYWSNIFFLSQTYRVWYVIPIYCFNLPLSLLSKLPGGISTYLSEQQQVSFSMLSCSMCFERECYLAILGILNISYSHKQVTLFLCSSHPTVKLCCVSLTSVSSKWRSYSSNVNLGELNLSNTANIWILRRDARGTKDVNMCIFLVPHQFKLSNHVYCKLWY